MCVLCMYSIRTMNAICLDVLSVQCTLYIEYFVCKVIVYVNGIFASSAKCVYVDMQTRTRARSCHFYGFSSPFTWYFWFDLLSLLFFFFLHSIHHLYVFFLVIFLLLRFVINFSRNFLPEYVNIEWSPSWLVNRIHAHSVNWSIFEMPTWYWMVPSSSNAYLSTEHSSDC